MKRFLPLIIIALALTSCQEDVKFSNPGFQALKDDVFWRANDARAYISDTGELKIEAYTASELLTLNTTTATEGTYVLGTTNTENSATYYSDIDGVETEYATIAVPGPVSSIIHTSTGSNYVSGDSFATTGGSGSGVTVDLVVNSGGGVTRITLASRGNGYVAGDLITVVGGDNNCKFRVVNVQNSNGEIIIDEVDTENSTVSGRFKINAAKANENPLGAEILNFQVGEFYKIPIYPSKK
ncbi:DUF6252 family protein [Flavobacterium sp.]